MRRKRIYLAGPDVFAPDAVARGRELVSLCDEFGYEGLYPLDTAVPTAADGGPTTKLAIRRWIKRANLALIRGADIVMANLAFFRGGEPDSGTCYECGYAEALGKAVFGYVPDAGSLMARMARYAPQLIGSQKYLTDCEGWYFEDMDFPVNLMLDFNLDQMENRSVDEASTRIVTGDARACLLRIQDEDRRAMIGLTGGKMEEVTVDPAMSKWLINATAEAVLDVEQAVQDGVVLASYESTLLGLAGDWRHAITTAHQDDGGDRPRMTLIGVIQQVEKALAENAIVGPFAALIQQHVQQWRSVLQASFSSDAPLDPAFADCETADDVRARKTALALRGMPVIA